MLLKLRYSLVSLVEKLVMRVGVWTIKVEVSMPYQNIFTIP